MWHKKALAGKEAIKLCICQFNKTFFLVLSLINKVAIKHKQITYKIIQQFVECRMPLTFFLPAELEFKYMLPVSLVLRTTQLEIDIKDRLEEYSQSIVPEIHASPQ